MPVESASIAQCKALVRARDEDRWLSACYAPQPVRWRLFALYALSLELERIPEVVSEPLLGDIRFQWWRDSLAEIAKGARPRAHPAVEAAAEMGIVAAAGAEIDAALDAYARLLDQPFASLEGFSAWCRRAEGSLARAALRISAPGACDAAAAEKAATAFAMARRARRLAPQLAAEARAEAQRLHSEAAIALGRLSAEAAPALAHFALTPLYAVHGPSSRARKRIRIFVAIARGRL